MRINHNISALQTNGNLRRTGNAMDKAMEKLSSGYKINRAADDAAGMAISRKMRTQIDGLSRASMNGSDGISVIQTAEGALNEVTSILQRCRELAVQTSNDVNTTDDRMAIKREIDELKKEINRISETTEFNTKTLLDGNLDNNRYTDNPKVNMIYTSDNVLADNYSMKVTQDPRQAILDCGTNASTNTGDFPIDKDHTGTITINGMSVKVEEGDSLDKVFSKLRDTCDIMDIDVFFGTYNAGNDPADRAGYQVANTFGTESLVFMSRGFGSNQKIDMQCSNPNLATTLGMATKTVSATGVDAKVDVDATTGVGFTPTATATADGDIVTVKDSGGFEMRFRVTQGAANNTFVDAKADDSVAASVSGGTTANVDATILDAGTMFLQIGANENQTMEVKIPRIDSETLNIDNVNVITHEGAERAITTFDNAVNFISQIRSKLGAYQNRLEHTIENLETANTNMTEAMSRIEDTDMAEEMTTFTQQNVLQQAGTAMLSQANQRPQQILSLLNG